MKPVAIFQHSAIQQAGYLLEVLERHGVPWRVFSPIDGDSVPTTATEFSGLVFLGSPYSVNDSLPWIRSETDLIQRAMASHKPVLGHCFGGQLIAKSMGAKVRPNAVHHIGWMKAHVTGWPEARRWFSMARELEIFHWHHQTFALPRDTHRMLFGSYCMNLGFTVGPHLALQGHLEVTEEILRSWCEQCPEDLAAGPLPYVQTREQILDGLPVKLKRLRRLADRV